MTNGMGVSLVLYFEMPEFALILYCYNMIYCAQFQPLSRPKRRMQLLNELLATSFNLENEHEFAKNLCEGWM